MEAPFDPDDDAPFQEHYNTLVYGVWRQADCCVKDFGWNWFLSLFAGKICDTSAIITTDNSAGDNDSSLYSTKSYVLPINAACQLYV